MSDVIPEAIVVTVTRVGVNMGDRGQDVTTALDVPASSTLRDLMEAAIPASTQWTTRDYDTFVTLRFAKALPEPKEARP